MQYSFITMLYAYHLMQSRTNLSLLFFVSTTYRISKKNLQRLSIPSLLEDLANPPQPLALRLYSSLVVGVVKVYILKMKNYEIEIQSLLVAIGSSRSKCRSKCSRSKKKLDVEDFHLLEESLPENCNALEGNCNSLENDVDDLLENSLDILNIKRIKMISIVDSQTEYTNISKFCLQNLTKSKYANYAKINYYANYAKINYYANYAKINYYAKYKIFSDSRLGVEENDFNDYNELDDFNLGTGFSIEGIRGSSIEASSGDLLLQEDTIKEGIFIGVGGRLNRATNFYLILEGCMKGEYQAYQKEPFGEILIIK